jgi:hypothetical protein
MWPFKPRVPREIDPLLAKLIRLTEAGAEWLSGYERPKEVPPRLECQRGVHPGGAVDVHFWLRDPEVPDVVYRFSFPDHYLYTTAIIRVWRRGEGGYPRERGWLATDIDVPKSDAAVLYRIASEQVAARRLAREQVEEGEAREAAGVIRIQTPTESMGFRRD